MKTFLKTYNDLIQSNNEYFEYIGLNIFKILNEWVESPDLLEFPKELQIELCKNLRNKCDNIYILSYQKIIQILDKYDYPYIEDVIAGLQKFHKNGYLIFICLDIDESEDLFENSTLKFIKENLNDIYGHAYDIFAKIYNNRFAEGLTIFHRDIFDPTDEYTCIFINRNATNMKDTLEHELTHFIKNVAKYSNKFPKVYSGLTTDKLKSKQLQCVDYLFNLFKKLQFPMETCLSIKEIVLRAFTESEEQPMIKSIINAIIRFYENDNKTYLVNHKQKSIKQIENMLDENELIEFRLNWLENFLTKLNNYEIFKENFELLNSYFSRKNYNKNKEVEFLLKCIGYLCFKYNYPEYNIDKILKANFKKFRMRDV